MRPISAHNPHREMIVHLASIADVGFGFFHSLLLLWHILEEDLKPIDVILLVQTPLEN